MTRGLAKVFVGEMVERGTVFDSPSNFSSLHSPSLSRLCSYVSNFPPSIALEVQRRRGGTGPLTPFDLREAYRAHLAERDRGGSDRRKMFCR